jgi:DNA-binding NarL/FixJ family response regulator
MKFLVIDDHVLIRQAMQGVLRKLRRDAVVLEAPNSARAMEIMASEPGIGLVLLDLTLPDREGFSVLAELRERYPAAPVVVLSAVQDAGNVMKALELGALGFIPKTAEGEVLLGALRLVLSGGIYVPPEILAHAELSDPGSKRGGADEAETLPQLVGLTDRQLDVLALMMKGKSNKTICRELNLAEPTVKNHVTAILRALNVSNRTEAVVAATQKGWKLPEALKS